MSIQINDIVEIVSTGYVYDGYEAMAIKLKATKWKKDALDDEIIKKGAFGIIRNFNRLPTESHTTICLVDLGDIEILIGEGGIIPVKNINNLLYREKIKL